MNTNPAPSKGVAGGYPAERATGVAVHDPHRAILLLRHENDPIIGSRNAAIRFGPFALLELNKTDPAATCGMLAPLYNCCLSTRFEGFIYCSLQNWALFLTATHSSKGRRLSKLLDALGANERNQEHVAMLWRFFIPSSHVLEKEARCAIGHASRAFVLCDSWPQLLKPMCTLAMNGR